MDGRGSFNHRPGLWIAVFGPDGAGKSAAIQRLTQELSLSFRDIERFHFRPRFRRRWDDSPPVTNPQGKPPRGFLLSVIKLLYWLADYCYGYLALIRPALLNSNLVLFDRYYPDVLVDPVRYRLPASTSGPPSFLPGWSHRLISTFCSMFLRRSCSRGSLKSLVRSRTAKGSHICKCFRRCLMLSSWMPPAL
jgi:hypothetical protein